MGTTCGIRDRRRQGVTRRARRRSIGVSDVSAGGTVGQVASRRAGGVASCAAHVLARGVARPAHRRGARQRKARVAGVADFVDRRPPGVAVEMTGRAGFDVAMHVGPVSLSRRRGGPEGRGNGQHEEKRGKGVPTTDALPCLTLHGSPNRLCRRRCSASVPSRYDNVTLQTCRIAAEAHGLSGAAADSVRRGPVRSPGQR